MKYVGRLFTRGVCALGIAVCLLPPLSTVHAGPVTINFSGLLSDMRDPVSASMGVLGPQVQGSSNVNVTLRTAGTYSSVVPGFFLKLDGSSSSATFAPGFLDGSHLRGVVGNRRDSWKPGVNVTGPSINGLDPAEYRVELMSKNMFTNENLQPPNLGIVLNKSNWRLNFVDDEEERARVKGGFSQLTAVPLPAAVVLFSAGLISLVGLGAGGLRNLKKAQV